MRQADFVFRQDFPCGIHVSFTQPITFPFRHTIAMLFHYIIKRHEVPEIAHSALMSSLQKFIEEERNRDFIGNYSSALNELFSNSININASCEQFDQAYRKHVSTYSTPMRPSDDELFCQAFHRVIHSSDAKELMRLEQSFAMAVSSEVDKRNLILKKLDDDLMNKTEASLQNLDPNISQTLTQMQESHIRDRELQESHWNSCISELKRVQRRELRSFVMSLEERHSALLHRPEFVLPPTSNSTLHFPPEFTEVVPDHQIRPKHINEPWSRSFTVQLGRQIRTTCNFRLLRANPENLLNSLSLISPESPCSETPGFSSDDLAARLSNAMGLYSNDLSGLVVVVDERVNSFRGINRHLAEACERSTEFHFPDLDCQLASIQDTIKLLGKRLPQAQNNERSASSTTDSPEQHRKPVEPVHGDVYVTKHSNLANGDGDLAGIGGGISVVFHLVQTEYPDRDEGRIRSGTPLHCALSGILRTCFDYDITTLTLPLLLVPNLREYMDVQWRARRAESVFKALKGALMDLSTWRGPTLRSIQFLVPIDLPDKELEAFVHTINTSFLQPVPLIVPG